MLKRGTIVKCIKDFVSKSQYPQVIYPRVGLEYTIKDVITNSNGEVSLRFFEIKNLHIQLSSGAIDEPTFCIGNFTYSHELISCDEVDKIINKCLKKK